MKNGLPVSCKSIVVLISSLMLVSLLSAQSSNEKIKATVTQSSAYLGYSVSISGNFAVAGAYMEDDLSSGYARLNSGAAYVFVNTGGNRWKQIQKLVPVAGRSEECFGSSVAISENKMIIGAQVSDDKAENAGAAYIYEKENDGTWKEAAKIHAEDPASYEFFGFSVAIEGNMGFVGAIQDGAGSSTDLVKGTGAVYVFQKRLGEWSQVQKITAPDATEEDYFGYAIAVSGDQLMIGSYAQDTDVKFGNDKRSAGAVYVYQREANGHWKFKQKLTPADREAENYFGSALSLSGKNAVIGAHKKNNGSVKGAGAVYLYELNEQGIWVEKQKVTDPEAEKNAHFGYSVSISGDEMIAGSCYKLDLKMEGAPFRGFVSRYKKNEEGIWERTEKYQSTEKKYDNWFGYSVAIDNGKYIIGAQKDGEGESQKSGAVYFRGECKPTHASVVVSSCTPYTFHGEVYDQSGIYQVILQNAAGCDSIVTFTLTINTVNTAVVSDQGKLISSANPASYQWINTETAEMISKANKKIFKPVEDGNYAVIVTQNGCKDTSEATTFVKMDLEKEPAKDIDEGLNVFPNPVSDILNVQLSTAYEELSVTLFDLTGKIVYQQTIYNSRFFTLDVNTYPVGTYLLTLETGEKRTVVKVVKN